MKHTPTAPAGRERRSSSRMRDKAAVRPEDAVGALQVAQDNLVEQIYELEGATPAHQTLRDLIIKDVLIVASIAFWPAMIYWLM